MYKVVANRLASMRAMPLAVVRRRQLSFDRVLTHGVRALGQTTLADLVDDLALLPMSSVERACTSQEAVEGKLVRAHA